MDGPRDRQGDREEYEILPHDDVQGVLFLAAGPDVDDVLLVEAQMAVIQHPVHIVGANATPAFTEYRLLETVRASR
jgi:hypothetical protein